MKVQFARLRQCAMMLLLLLLSLGANAQSTNITGDDAGWGDLSAYHLIYKVDGSVYKDVLVKVGDTVSPIESPVKEGYTFSGWSYIPAKMPAEDVTVTGSFSVNSYTLTYIVDGQVISTESVAYGTSLTAKVAPTKEGYTFSGWSEIPSTMPAKDVTVTGNFTVNSYTLTYVVDGKTVSSESVAYGTALTAKVAPTKEGYTFSGWSEIPSTMPAKDVTVTGNFSINSYTIAFVIDGDTIQSSVLAYGSSVVAPQAPERDGYTFDGWMGLPESMPCSDVTVIGSYSINDSITQPTESDLLKSVYDLSGRFIGRLDAAQISHLTSGIYIINNRKVVISK